jgi:hypothetical protein
MCQTDCGHEQSAEKGNCALTGRGNSGMEMTAQWGASWFTLIQKYNPDDQINKHNMNGVCDTGGGGGGVD